MTMTKIVQQTAAAMFAMPNPLSLSQQRHAPMKLQEKEHLVLQELLNTNNGHLCSPT